MVGTQQKELMNFNWKTINVCTDTVGTPLRFTLILILFTTFINSPSGFSLLLPVPATLFEGLLSRATSPSYTESCKCLKFCVPLGKFLASNWMMWEYEILAHWFWVKGKLWMTYYRFPFRIWLKLSAWYHTLFNFFFFTSLYATHSSFSWDPCPKKRFAHESLSQVLILENLT